MMPSVYCPVCGEEMEQWGMGIYECECGAVIDFESLEPYEGKKMNEDEKQIYADFYEQQFQRNMEYTPEEFEAYNEGQKDLMDFAKKLSEVQNNKLDFNKMTSEEFNKFMRDQLSD